MDGVRYDFPQLTNNGGFDLIELDGLKATSLVPVYQSSTFPAHISMATGVTPDKHGVLHNSFYDKTRGSYSYSADASWIEAEPVWSILERNNIKTATYFWVGSETDWNGTQISYSKAPFDGGVLEKDKTKKGFFNILKTRKKDEKQDSEKNTKELEKEIKNLEKEVKKDNKNIDTEELIKLSLRKLR